MKKYSIFIALILTFIFLFPIVPAQAQQSYEVKSGDSLWTISKKFDVSLNQIMQQNNINNPTELKVGQRLIITWTNTGITITVEDQNDESDYRIYTVKSGDSLWKISNKFNTTIEEILNMNNLSSNYIYYGQKIKIPAKDTNNNDGQSTGNNYTYYTVKPGDILWNIAQKYNTTVARLVELNDIQNAYDLYAGRRLLVEINNSYYPEENQYKIPEKQRFYKPYTFYKVKENDYIWGIADQFGVRVSQIIAENNIGDINQIQKDKVLIIPLNNSTKASYIKRINKELNNYYRVQRNDTLSDIADYFNIPENVIKRINNLSNDNSLYTGQELLMPVSLAFFKKHQIYTVPVNNEPVHEIAYQKGLSIRSILKANYSRNLNAKFNKGTKLIIPLDEESKAVWRDYKDGKPVDSIFN